MEKTKTDIPEKNQEEQSKENRKNLIVEALKGGRKKWRISVLVVLVVLALLASIVIGYFCVNWLESIWDYGFKPGAPWWKAILAVLGAFYLVIFPFVPFLFIRDTISGILKLYTDEDEKDFVSKLKQFEEKQSDSEKVLRDKDTEGLIDLIKYSRNELLTYYNIGYSQVQGSYKYSIAAMWIGFIIIVFGIVSYIIIPSEINKNFADGNFQILVIGSGIIIEMVSGLFLWIYNKSIRRSTYFYNRQVFIHNSILAYKISNTMKDSDKAKEMIVEKILEFGFNSNKDANQLLKIKNQKKKAT